MKTARLTIALFLIFTGITAFPQPARAGWLTFFFPSLRETDEADPAVTLQAPFAPKSSKDAAMPDAKIGSAPENLVPLEKPHTSSAHIAAWLIDASSELMSFAGPGYAADFAQHTHYFSSEGLQQYQAWLAQKNMLKTLDSGQYKIQTVVQSTPALLNEGAVDGRYRWLYEVPVMISYMPRGITTYKNASPVTRTMKLLLQVGRMESANAAQAVYIERWGDRPADSAMAASAMPGAALAPIQQAPAK